MHYVVTVEFQWMSWAIGLILEYQFKLNLDYQTNYQKGKIYSSRNIRDVHASGDTSTRSKLLKIVVFFLGISWIQEREKVWTTWRKKFCSCFERAIVVVSSYYTTVHPTWIKTRMNSSFKATHIVIYRPWQASISSKSRPNSLPAHQDAADEDLQARLRCQQNPHRKGHGYPGHGSQ